MGHDILIVDDEADIRELISDTLKDEGFETRLAKNSTETFAALNHRVPTIAILDIWLKDSELDGLGILEAIKRKYPDVPVVMISGHGNIETAISSIRMGAFDYIEKPFKEDRLLHLVKRAIEIAKLKHENDELKLRIGPRSAMIGQSAAITQLRQSIDRVAPTGSRVFVTGPAGAGKEVAARMVHDKSQRKTGPFVVMSAASMTSDFVDRELFGTEDSQMSGPPRKVGLFERADGGTLFIDEITDMPLPTQSKFLRVLQENTFERVGGNKPIKVDVRVIVASCKDIDEEIRQGNFREDLYYRLNVVPLKVPKLSERREDIPMLCAYFLESISNVSGVPMRKLSDDALAALQAYDWPGNVRQLRNVIEWLLIMSPGDSETEISSNMLPHEIFSSTPAMVNPSLNTDILSMPLREARETFEKQYLMAQINRFGGNISRTSNFIEMERSALHRKLKSLNIQQKVPHEEVS